MKKYEKVLSIILFILTAAFLCFNVCTSSTEIIPVKIALCAASIIIAGLTNYCIFLLYKKKYMSTKLHQAVYIITAIIMLIASINFVPQLMQERDMVQVTIECGEKNEDAKGGEFWLFSIKRDGVQHSPETLQILELSNINYSSEYDAYLYTNSDGSGKGRMVVQLYGGEDVQLIFASHPYCGIIYIEDSVNQSFEKIDLYSSYSTKYNYDVPLGALTPLVRRVAICILYMATVFVAIELVVLLLLSFVLWMKKKGKFNAASVVMGIAATLLPVVYLMFQFSQNASEVNFLLLLAYMLLHTFLIAICYILLLCISSSALVSYIGCALLCIFIFSSSSINNILTGFIDPMRQFDHSEASVMLLGGLCCIIFFIIIWKLHNKKISTTASGFILMFTSLLVVFNVPIGVTSYIQQLKASDEFTFKKEFTISETMESELPNIYWFHCDGMLGFSAFEKYFQDDQSEFAQELEDRGFQINRDANFEAGHASVMAIPSLMSPYFYDDYLSAVVAATPNRTQLHNLSESSTLGEVLRLARLNSELLTAFSNTAAYTVVQLASYANAYYPPIGDVSFEPGSTKIYRIDTDPEETKSNQTTFSVSEFSKLEVFLDSIALPSSLFVRKIFPLGFESLSGMFETPVQKTAVADVVKDPINTNITQALQCALEEGNDPKFVLYFDSTAHNPYIYDENGNKTPEYSMDVMAYPPQHIYATKVYINAIDLILSYDPDAVIILQADHGLHGNSLADFQKAFGDEAVAEDLWNYVMSAVRIPEKYRNGEEEYAFTNPLNISRYLVNRFVGQNYEYLPANTPIK